MAKDLNGKVALITGGSRGIGAAIATRLARDGARVAFTYANAGKTAEALVARIESDGGSALAIRADSSDAGAVKNAVAETAMRFGRLDILVNSAGIATIKPIVEFTLEDFDRIVSVNVRGAFIAIRAAAVHMDEGGRIITIGSVNADRMPFVGGAVYAMTKAAIAGLVRGLARDLGPRGITVNNVQPGPVDTELNPAEGPFAETLKGLMAIKRYGSGDEIAGLVAYLAGPESGFVTGASWTIDGGFAA